MQDFFGRTVSLSGTPDRGVVHLLPEVATALDVQDGSESDVIPVRSGCQAEPGGAVR